MDQDITLEQGDGSCCQRPGSAVHHSHHPRPAKPRRPPIHTLKYLAGYPPGVLARVQALIAEGGLGTRLAERYREPRAVRNDGQLYDYVQSLKKRHMRKSVPLRKVALTASCR